MSKVTALLNTLGASAPLVAAAAYGVYYYTTAVKRPTLVFKDNDKNRSILNECPSLLEKYWPTFWCFNGHASTIVSGLFRTTPALPLRREHVSTGDGGEVCLDWYSDEEDAKDTSKPLVIILHGLTGGSQESYARHLMIECKRRGYVSVVFNNRGCANSVLKTPRGYCAACTKDFRSVLAHIRATHPNAPLFAVGISLGSIILVKYLAESGEDAGLVGAMSVSNAWDLDHATASLETPPSLYLYNRRLCNNLKNLVHKNRHVFDSTTDHGINLDTVMQARTIREFDQSIVVPTFKYDSVKHYYDDASSVNHIENVRVPLLCLNAADDPFSPLHGIPVGKFEGHPTAILAITARGGHIAFVEGALPIGRSYLDRVFGEFSAAIFGRAKQKSD